MPTKTGRERPSAAAASSLYSLSRVRARPPSLSLLLEAAGTGAWPLGGVRERARERARRLLSFRGSLRGGACAPPACPAPGARPLAPGDSALPCLALRGAGVAPEFKRTAAVGGEATACPEPNLPLTDRALGRAVDLSFAAHGVLSSDSLEQSGWQVGWCRAGVDAQWPQQTERKLWPKHARKDKLVDGSARVKEVRESPAFFLRSTAGVVRSENTTSLESRPAAEHAAQLRPWAGAQALSGPTRLSCFLLPGAAVTPFDRVIEFSLRKQT